MYNADIFFLISGFVGTAPCEPTGKMAGREIQLVRENTPNVQRGPRICLLGELRSATA